MLLLLGSSLRRGYSGVRVELVELVLSLLDRGVTPLVPSRGSVGSSGDLAPLAHLGLVLIGEGEATFGGERMPGAQALARAGLEPIELTAKEGLALVNGTHLMAAAGTLALREATRLVEAAIVAVALSLEAFKGSTVPFDERLHALRPQLGPARVAGRLRGLLEGSDVVASHADCGRVQDPYTLRCAPQVIGAVDDALRYVAGPLEHELEAVTDNPLVFPARAWRRGARRGQLPRAAALAAARSPCARDVRAGRVQRAAHLCPAVSRLRGAAAVPLSTAGPQLRPDDHPVRRSRARERMPGACPPRRRGVDPHLSRNRGLQLDGRARRAQGSRHRRERCPGDRDRARLRLPGARVSPPAAHDRGAGAGRRAGPGATCPASRRTVRWRPSSLRWPRRCAAARSSSRSAGCRREPGRHALPWLAAGGGAADAPEQPPSGRGRAAGRPGRVWRSGQGCAQPRVLRRDRERARTARRGRNAAGPVGQAGGGIRNPPGGAAGADRQLQPRARVGHLGALPRARCGWADDVRPDDGGVLDLHRDPGHPPGHLRDVRGARPPTLRWHAGRPPGRDRRPGRHGRGPAAGHHDERRYRPLRGGRSAADRASHRGRLPRRAGGVARRRTAAPRSSPLAPRAALDRPARQRRRGAARAGPAGG